MSTDIENIKKLAEDKTMITQFINICKNNDSGSYMESLNAYLREFNFDVIKYIEVELIKLFNIFEDWHPGLNQLKKFHGLAI